MTTLIKFSESPASLHRVRGHLVMLQDDLARLYGTPPDQVAACACKFPGELCFPLEGPEIAGVADEPVPLGPPFYAFTEFGALALAYALATPEAITSSARVVRTFLHSRPGA